MIPADQARYLPGRVLAFFAGIASPLRLRPSRQGADSGVGHGCQAKIKDYRVKLFFLCQQTTYAFLRQVYKSYAKYEISTLKLGDTLNIGLIRDSRFASLMLLGSFVAARRRRICCWQAGLYRWP
jgi:hypothetical protein